MSQSEKHSTRTFLCTRLWLASVLLPLAIGACGKKPSSADAETSPMLEETDELTFEFASEPMVGEITYQARAQVERDNRSHFTFDIRIEQRNGAACRGTTLHLASPNDYIEEGAPKKLGRYGGNVWSLRPKAIHRTSDEVASVYRRDEGPGWFIVSPKAWDTQCLLRRSSVVFRQNPEHAHMALNSPNALVSSKVGQQTSLQEPIRKMGSETRLYHFGYPIRHWWSPIVNRETGQLIALAYNEASRTLAILDRGQRASSEKDEGDVFFVENDDVGFTDRDRALAWWTEFIDCVFDPTLHVRRIGPRRFRTVPEAPEERKSLLIAAEAYWFEGSNGSQYQEEIERCSFIKVRSNE